jgi:hypothetical protein
LSSVSYIFWSFGGVSLTGHPFVSLRQVLQGGMLRNTFPACSSSFPSIVRLLAIFRDVLPSIGYHLRSTILSQLSTIFVCAIFETRPASFASHYRIVPSIVSFISPWFGIFPPALPTDHFFHSCHHTVSTASRCLQVTILLCAAMFTQASSIFWVPSAGFACFRYVMIAEAILIP